jgi:hypothetical protein
MKGIVFNLFEEVVRRTYGEDTWDDLLDAANLGGSYTSLGSYDDRDLFRLADAASERLNMPTYDVVRWLGREALPLLAQKYPPLFDAHTDTRSFVLALNDIIHPEVRKLYPGANVPAFTYDTSSPDVLGMTYQSPRRLCAFAEGLVEGAAAHYRESVVFVQPRCMHRGDPSCSFRISFARLPR